MSKSLNADSSEMNRRGFISTCGAILASAGLSNLGCATVETRAPSVAKVAAGKPNVVLIVADDLGYGELSIQGSTDISTPYIDSIARNGVRFTNGYVTCPVCSPTRAGLMTGRYQQRFGHEFNPGPAGAQSDTFGLPRSEKTIAERMKTLGYATGMVGKWHLGMRDRYTPTDRGFDEFYGFLGGAHSYVNAKHDARNPILRGKEPVAEISYTTDVFAQEACAFIERHKSEPFFLYLPFNAVHGPMDALEKYLARYKSIGDEKRRKFAGMLSAMDTAVGEVLGKLRDTQLVDNTLVIFISDNGGPTRQTTAKNDPLRGFKGEVFEGGIRVPFMMQWPGKIPAVVKYEQPVISLDIVPTIIAAVGGSIGNDAIEGVDIVPYVKGDTTEAPHETLCWRHGDNWAIRKGNYKLLTMRNNTALYDLSKDIHEDNDLSTQLPDKAKELKADWDAWNAKNVDPLWVRTTRPRPG